MDLVAVCFRCTEPVVIAHRGGSRLRPENTLASFDHAVALGVDALECDVHLSARRRAGRHPRCDARPDDRTRPDRSPTGAADELARLDAGFHGSAPTTATRFAGAASACRASRRCSIAIRADCRSSSRSRAIVRRSASGRSPSCARPGAVDRVIFGGFSHDVLDDPPPAGAGRADERLARRDPADAAGRRRRGAARRRPAIAWCRRRSGSRAARSSARTSSRAVRAARLPRAGLDRRRAGRHAADHRVGCDRPHQRPAGPGDVASKSGNLRTGTLEVRCDVPT